MISYLERRFDSQVELAALRVRVPRFSPVRALFRRGRGAFATVEGDGVLLRHKGCKKRPLRFDIHRLRLESTGTNQVMKYDAALTNAKPLGEIQSAGTFGPWAAGEPGDTPIDGAYRFVDADLGVFSGVAGILQSSGRFKGSLSSIRVQGEATVPDELLLDGQFEISQGRFLRSTIQDQIDTLRGDHLSITLICRARLGRRSCRQL